MLLRLLEKLRLLLEDTQGFEVCRHVPRNAQMRRLTHEVAGHGARQLTRTQDQHLAARRMPADVADLHSRQNLSVAVEELDRFVPIGKWREVVDHVARAA